MPRDTMAVQTIAKLSGINNLTLTTVVAANGLDYANDGQDFVLFLNEDGSIRTVTIVSVADPITGRTGDVALAVPAAAGGVPGVAIAGPFPQRLFNQSTGKVNINIDGATTVRAAVFTWTKFE